MKHIAPPFFAAVLLLAGSSTGWAQADEQAASTEDRLADLGAAVFGLFQKPVRPSLEPVSPTGGLTAGIGISPKSWRNEARIKTFRARASVSVREYWALDGSFAWQQSNSWRFEPYIRLRSMNRLGFFGLGNDSTVAHRTTFSLLERRAGTSGWRRPVPWLAVGGRGEVLWMRTGAGHDPDVPSIEERFALVVPGIDERADFLHVQGFVNLNYPTGRNELPRRGGDYRIAFDHFQDTSGGDHSFRRLEVEGQERFTVFGRDRQFTLHALLSAAFVSAGQTVPFYMMDTLGGADNLRGFREDIIGSDQTTATLRAFDSFRFRDSSSVLLQTEFRQRIGSSPFFVSVFGDAGMVAPRFGDLRLSDVHRGAGVSLSMFRGNVLAIRADVSVWGGEGHPRFFTPGKAFGF